MILQGIREQEGLHIAKDTQKHSQDKTVGFIRPSTRQPSQHDQVYQAIKEMGKAKCYASEPITELGTPTPELA